MKKKQERRERGKKREERERNRQEKGVNETHPEMKKGHEWWPLERQADGECRELS